ncbi:superoxide dismutase [Fe] [Candidatus Falkowbacteria bacterium HGW-Falkowbacteria-2]|uniref:Superoxide dismutase n=1 Tax=Candidatus Falkowbacteria bacterium HGW-Falkowbacteria-2 TaxID=2013769 RepID=A0A2N2E1D1_9BACT|nr:MAG: superoxide dismutase [Fe] [Candidatus Falkowbacteria bacterium HGW-Falkowbacteria-2]
MFTLKSLPYAAEALAPHISGRTMNLHHGKHHQAYIDNLNKLIEGTAYEKMELEDIIKETHGKEDLVSIFNNAGQVYNHFFFWESLRPAQETINVPADLLTQIDRDFGSFEKMAEQFKAVALSQFGSGWTWLALEEDKLKIIKAPNGEPAFLKGAKPLLALDVWEHSYYLDYENRRAEYVDAVLNHLFNWDFAARNAIS